MTFNKNHSPSTTRDAAGLGLLVGFLGIFLSSIPFINSLEHDLGLDWLFKLRGPLPASSQVSIAAMDRASSDALGFPNLPRKWNRSVHAELISNLTKNSVSAIGFDVLFSEPREGDQDQLFAEALKNSNNTILFKNLFTTNHENYRMERLEPPIPVLETAALDTAPFALPKVPAKVSQAWLYKSGAGDSPTLPMVLLHVYMEPLLPQFIELLTNSLQNLGSETPVWLNSKKIPTLPSEQASLFRSLFNNNQLLVNESEGLLSDSNLSNDKKEKLRSWIYALSRGDSIILNLYGPARSVTTLPLHHYLPNRGEIDVSGKAVFVGYSEILQPEQKDGFYTSFTGEDGVDISGVELMATTFSNLLNREAIQAAPTTLRLGSIFAVGFLVASLGYLLTGGASVLFAGIAAATWLGISTWLFTQHQLWMPLSTILLFQIPVGLVLALVWQFRKNRRTKDRLAGEFKKFVPPELVDHLDKTGDLSKGIVVPAVCLFTDMESFTPLGESLDPEKLHKTLNEYFNHLRKPVSNYGGRVADMTGDSMLSVWSKGTPEHQVLMACRAALAIQSRQHEIGTSTRIGIHLGEIYLGPLGAGDHLEYRAIGDTVNTAKRLESLNKQLGTKILISAATLKTNPQLENRRLGGFLLKGKSTPMEVHELRGCPSEFPAASSQLSSSFELALADYDNGKHVEAEKQFAELISEFDDQASKYYAELCKNSHTSSPPL